MKPFKFLNGKKFVTVDGQAENIWDRQQEIHRTTMFRQNYYTNLIIEMFRQNTGFGTNIYNARRYFVEDNVNKSLKISNINQFGIPGTNSVTIYYTVSVVDDPTLERTHRTYMTHRFYTELTNA